jgi:hypothetical protein
MNIIIEDGKTAIKLDEKYTKKYIKGEYLYSNFFDHMIEVFWDKNIDISLVEDVWYLVDNEGCKLYLLTSDLSELETKVFEDRIVVCEEITDVEVLNQIYFSKCIDK